MGRRFTKAASASKDCNDLRDGSVNNVRRIEGKDNLVNQKKIL
jgi:hypothetical protein